MSTFTKDSTFTLTNGVEIPAVGFGTFRAEGDAGEKAILDALDAGYRHLDTASMYQNEEVVGQAIKKSGIPREEIFVTTKLWNDIRDYEGAKTSLATSLKKLDLEYVDLFLIHWPNPASLRHIPDAWEARNRDIWRYLEEALEQGLVRAIGVSDFHERHIDSLLETANVVPHVNQIYVSPSDLQLELVAANAKHHILTQAYSPLGKGTLLDAPELKELAQKYGKTPAQVILRWNLQKGYNPLPKSVTPSRIRENIDLFDFELSADELQKMDTLKGIGQVAVNPDEVDF